MPSYVIVTEPNQERRVVEQLADHAIPAYCPVQRRKAFGLRITIKEGPIFPGYVFVHTDDVDRDFETIRHRTAYVVAFLTAGGSSKPKAIPDEWLGAFLVMQSLGGFDYAADRRPRLRIGQFVKVVAGQFGAMNYGGVITEFRGRNDVTLSLHRFGTRLTVATGDLRAA